MNPLISNRFNSDFDQVFIPQRFIQTELGFSQPMFTTKGEAWVIEKLVSEWVAA